ncbi:MAG: hypothetical protein ACM3MG_00840 [Bacillota bacterium]
MAFNRRDLLIAGVGSLFGFALPKTISKLSTQSNKYDSDIPPYTIYGLGMEGHRFPGGQGYLEHKESVITELDLVSGIFKQTLLPMPNGHIVTILNGEKLVCTPIQGSKIFVLSLKHETEKILESEAGTIFGGHGTHLPDLGLFIASVKSENLDKPGYLAAYDDRTFELKRKIEINALYPHDLRPVPGKPSQVVVSHGSQSQSFQSSHLGKDPVASIIDVSTGEILRRFTDFQLQGLNHVTISENGDIYTSQLISLPPNEASLQKFDEDFPGVKWAWGDGTGTKLDRLPYPAPVLWFPQKGAPQALMSHPGQFLRHQDITYHSNLNQVYSTYSESNSIAVINSRGEIKTVDAGLFGVYKVRGIRAIPNSPLVLINDSENGIALVDMKEQKLKQFYHVQLFLTRHITLKV